MVSKITEIKRNSESITFYDSTHSMKEKVEARVVRLLDLINRSRYLLEGVQHTIHKRSIVTGLLFVDNVSRWSLHMKGQERQVQKGGWDVANNVRQSIAANPRKDRELIALSEDQLARKILKIWGRKERMWRRDRKHQRRQS
jgi:hypothetical protein